MTQPSNKNGASRPPAFDPNMSLPAWLARGAELPRRFTRSHVRRYKQATDAFKRELEQLCPSEIFEGRGVQVIVDAVNYIQDEDLSVTSSLLTNVTVALRDRTLVDRAFGENSDEGHRYITKVLAYARHVLLEMRRSQKADLPSRISKDAENKENADENPFAVLADEDDEEIMLEDLPVETQAPELPPFETRLEDLLNGSDCFQARMFLVALNEIMDGCLLQYRTLKQELSDPQFSEFPEQVHVERLLGVTVVANFAIQLVEEMEQALMTDHPHLATSYRIMAIGIFPHMITDLQTIFAKPVPSQDVVTFFGDCLETYFRNHKSDPFNRKDDVVREFARRWDLPTKIVEDGAEAVRLLAVLLAGHRQDREKNLSKVQSLPQDLLPFDPAILSDMAAMPQLSNIGGKSRSILYTHKLLQSLSSVYNPKKGLILKRGFFGKQWDEHRKKASDINRDLDEFLLGDVMPILLDLCSRGLVSRNIRFKHELLPLYDLMGRFVKAGGKEPVSFAFSYAVHLLLTSVIELQGSGHIQRLTDGAKFSFDLFYDQLGQLQEADQPCGQHWRTNIATLSVLKHIATPVSSPHPEQRLIDRALWNPLTAGMSMLYTMFVANVEGASATIDDFSQLRIVLHLYNGLKQVGAPVEDMILEKLDKLFENSPAVWDGRKPVHGELVYQWWRMYGVRSDVARRRADETKLRQRGVPVDMQCSPNPCRGLKPIEPGDMFKAFRYICLHDFTGLVDQYHTDEQRKRAKRGRMNQTVYEHAVRSNDTLDTLDDEMGLLGLNLVAMSWHLNFFVEKMSKAMGWDEKIAEMIRTMPPDALRGNSWETSRDNFRRFAIANLFANEVLGAMDAMQVPLVGEPPKPVVRSMACLSLFNQGLMHEHLQFVAPVEWEEE